MQDEKIYLKLLWSMGRVIIYIDQKMTSYKPADNRFVAANDQLEPALNQLSCSINLEIWFKLVIC